MKTLKKLSRLCAVLLACTLLTVTAIPAQAQNDEGNGFVKHAAQFDYIVGINNTVHLTRYTGESETVDIPSQIDGMPVVELLTSENPYERAPFEGVFSGNTAIKSVTLPDTVEIIGNDTFFRCTSLKSVKLGESVRHIGGGAFSNTALESIDIPASVKHIGYNAFGGSSELAEINADPNNEFFRSIGGVLYSKDMKQITAAANAKTGSFTIPETVEKIGAYAFSGCKHITRINIPDSVKIIGQGAIENCDSLKSLTIPDSVETMEIAAINSCGALESVELPKNIKRIPAYFMKNCTSVREITIPRSVTEIDIRAFTGCSSLSKAIVPSSVTKIREAFIGCPDLTIYGDAHSDAQKYAFSENIPFKLLGTQAAPGDIDSDGTLTASDALMILRASAGMTELDDETKAIADVDGDGSITANDALAVLRASSDITDDNKTDKAA